MRVLVLSAYAAHSHVYWQRALQIMFGDWQWRVLSLPPRYFSWRVRGNAMYWSRAERAALESSYDLLLATSMVDLATLRGLVPMLAALPTVVYFHENQFNYPQHRQQHSLLEAQVTSIYTALAADRILFNSHFNQDSFMAGCASLLRKMPDCVPPDIESYLRKKSSVLPVPIHCGEQNTVAPHWPSVSPAGPCRPIRLLWAGRFEHDKGADGLLRILEGLENAGLDYELAMTGQQFRQSPSVFSEIQSAFSRRLVQFGYVEDERVYRGLLQAADIVVSTALHEFQGLAVLEAVAHNCIPVVPDRLAYPEIYPPRCRYASSPDDQGKEAEIAVTLILKLAQELRSGGEGAPDVSAFSTTRLATAYEQVFRSTVRGPG